MNNIEKCPYYQGVCGLNEDFICYTSADSCDIYRDYIRKNDNADNSEQKSHQKQGGNFSCNLKESPD